MSVLDSLTLTRIPPEDEALRAEVRAFLQEAVRDLPAHIRARSWGGYSAELSRALAAHGWVGITLAREYGGGGRSAFARYVLVEEFLNAGAPVGSHWIADRQSAPLILKYGTEAQKQFYVPRVCRGEAFFCIGMSEPGSGSDLASVKTRATPNEHGFLLNGQKIWTTNAQGSQYMIALVRTSGSAQDRHKGLSQVIVDLSLPGVTVRPIQDLSGDSHFCEVFFDDVQLAPDALIGAEGQGWEQVTAELAFERSGPERLFSSIVLFDQWLAWVRTPAGRSDAATRLAGKVLTQLSPLRAMSVAVQEKLTQGASPIAQAALVKELGTTLEQFIPAAIADDLFSREQPEDVPVELLLTLKYVTEAAPSYSLRGGTRDILRGMIARGLGLR
ncbi:acyl-CoA dehydrogenase [Melaminivora suipulveris]|uniref:Acyl-CoA dehydrogenase n=1 Tax=Melaminivora suipulveris TaxID=2109913 RepID=A0A2R3QCG7_9BURK|nr:acyl-CoA dehydrogenase family protein [Melaminivora suipulveris]AVO49472.1 acyl-CoA dehydrogenase [Melaminivora suipulveris]